MIKVENVSFCNEAGEGAVLRAVSLEVGRGQYVALVGPNGCGKSTLAKHMNGLLSPTEGNVWVDGMNTRDRRALREIRRRVGMIFQNPDNQIVGMTVEEDVAFGPENLSLAPAEIRQRVNEALEEVGLAGYARRIPHTLSGGEKQLLSLAGVLAMHPRYIILDEPASSLDFCGRERLFSVLDKLRRRGITIIHITHNMDEITEADRVVVMNGGQIVLEGSPREVFSLVEQVKALGLGVPKVTELMWRLKQAGEAVRSDVVTIDEAFIELVGRR
ncbi:MAG: energy-coupling factor transporter ATPase, partial [Clostridia bacterium]|nr:energy-coupling factor transporter ATPase [Clostridia bacterium]